MDAVVILAFDTSGPHVAVALLVGSECPVVVRNLARGQAEALVPEIETLLSANGANWTDLTAIGVGVGPGNFTGIRISVSAARGMGLGLGIPVIGVSAFDTTRQIAASQGPVTVPAPRDQVYLSLTSDGPPELVKAEEAPASVAARDFATAEHARAIAQIAKRRLATGVLTPAKPLYVKPADAAPARDAPPTIVDA